MERPRGTGLYFGCCSSKDVPEVQNGTVAALTPTGRLRRVAGSVLYMNQPLAGSWALGKYRNESLTHFAIGLISHQGRMFLKHNEMNKLIGST